MKPGLYRKDFCFMLMRTVIFASIAAALATQVPSLLTRTTQPGNTISANFVSTEDSAPDAPATITDGGMIRLQADAQGHYTGNFRINGKPVTSGCSTLATQP